MPRNGAIIVNSQNGLRVSYRKGDFFPDFADSCRRNLQERCYVLQVDLLNNLRTAIEQLDIALFHGQTVGVEMLRINLKKQVLVYLTRLFLQIFVHLEEAFQFFTVNQIDLTCRLCNNRNVCT